MRMGHMASLADIYTPTLDLDTLALILLEV